jgi:hypothetical protein
VKRWFPLAILVIGLAGSVYAAVMVRQATVATQQRSEASARATWRHTTATVVNLASSASSELDQSVIVATLSYPDWSGRKRTGTDTTDFSVVKGQKVGVWVTRSGRPCLDIEDWNCSPAVEKFAGYNGGRNNAEWQYNSRFVFTFICGYALCLGLAWLTAKRLR